ncbi:hypothetical protein A1F94_008970 [Pyrenophora tritici-repentis]|nr:hypothetical protein A1F94_008970 [Pyrenophora tritici-repentis]
MPACTPLMPPHFHLKAITALSPRLRGRLPPLQPRLAALNTRLYSAVTAPPRCERIQVPCRSNGSFTVDVFHAAKPAAPILLYLPPGPVLPEYPEEEERVIATLREASATTVVRINYRASSIGSSPDELPVVKPEDLPEPLYGDETALLSDEDLAGSLASVEIDQDATQQGQKLKKKRAPKAPPPTAWQTYGDNDVIPTLTLSGERDPDNPTTAQQLDDLLDMETQLALSHYATFEDNVNFSPRAPPALPTLSRCRAYARHYPPAGTRLSLPVWNITIGLQSPLSDITLELAKMLRRSIARQTLKSHSGRSRWHDAVEKKQYEDFAHDRVQLNSYQGIGLWTQQDDNPKWEQRVQEVGIWMKQRLDPAFT